MTKDEINAILSRYWRPAASENAKASLADYSQIDAFFGCELPPAFQMFRTLLPSYEFSGDHLAFEEMRAVYESEVNLSEAFSPDHLPFYAVGNGDYICFSISAYPESEVFYVAHDEPKPFVIAPSFEALLDDSEWW